MRGEREVCLGQGPQFFLPTRAAAFNLSGRHWRLYHDELQCLCPHVILIISISDRIDWYFPSSAYTNLPKSVPNSFCVSVVRQFRLFVSASDLCSLTRLSPFLRSFLSSLSDCSLFPLDSSLSPHLSLLSVIFLCLPFVSQAFCQSAFFLPITLWHNVYFYFLFFALFVFSYTLPHHHHHHSQSAPAQVYFGGFTLCLWSPGDELLNGLTLLLFGCRVCVFSLNQSQFFKCFSSCVAPVFLNNLSVFPCVCVCLVWLFERLAARAQTCICTSSCFFNGCQMEEIQHKSVCVCFCSDVSVGKKKDTFTKIAKPFSVTSWAGLNLLLLLFLTACHPTKHKATLNFSEKVKMEQEEDDRLQDYKLQHHICI